MAELTETSSKNKTLKKTSSNNISKLNEKIDLKLLRTSFDLIPPNSLNLNDSVSSDTTTSTNIVSQNLMIQPKLLASLKKNRKNFQQNNSKKFSIPNLNKAGSKKELNDSLIVNPNGFSKETLAKRMIEHFETLDKDMHFEFCVRFACKKLQNLQIFILIFRFFFKEIRNPNNKTFEDSLKMTNERKSRYKHVYPCKYIEFLMKYHIIIFFILKDDDNRVKLEMIPGRPDSDFINASFIQVNNLILNF